jgi:hypothetical protein
MMAPSILQQRAAQNFRAGSVSHLSGAEDFDKGRIGRALEVRRCHREVAPEA